MAKTVAAIGFKVHTGWVTCVAITGPPDSLEVLARYRAVVLPEAAQLDAASASDLVSRAEQAARALADAAVGELLDELVSHNAIALACGVIVGSAQLRAGTELAAILVAQIRAACEQCELPVTTVRERDVWAAAAQSSGYDEAALRMHVDALRRRVGTPWTADQKSATAAAIAASVHHQRVNLA